ncbi:hypothetical protein AFLA_003465 [Aspergillus flavus NRRL3357]|nr:hypothetical protein AFLA_003465 [Aspergillus flavus NRRL3357]
MESMPPDAFDSHPTSPYAGQLHGAGNPDLDSINGVTATTAPFVKVDDPPKFELESYIANYTGRTKFNRLFLIGTCSTYLSVEALKAAIVEAKSSKDVSRYERAVRALADVAPYEAEATPDKEWIDRTRKVVKAETDRLEHELRGYKNNLIKESIRMGNEDLGQHYHQIGDLVSASKAYSRMRDYCTTPSHIASMLFKIINVAIERGDWLSVQSHVQRLRNLQSKQEEQAKNQPKMSAAMGLSQLHSGAYLDAANSFLSTDPTLGDSYNEVLTSNDVAVYGGLCALASMDRNELQRRVLDNNILESYQTDYLLDVHLQRHVSTLYTRIRTKSIQQYLVPFSRVKLDTLSKIFAPGATSGQAQPIHSKSPFVQELIGLIQDEVQEAVLESLSNYIDEAHIRVLRTNIIRAGLEVRPLGDEQRKQGHGPKHSRPPTGMFQ